MSQDYPPLTLDDLVHIRSPSPPPQTLLEDSESSLHTSVSPEPLSESDIVQIRRNVIKMRHIDSSDAPLTSREKELAEMVLRLTAPIKPGSDQLLRQADMISALIQHRDLLLSQAEEQHLRWDSERDGWARMAEALLAQQAKNWLNPEPDEDLERLHAAEIDNRSLRQRLNESQSRLQALESELTRLRPLLLMQPLVSRSSMPTPTPNPKTQYSRRRKKDLPGTEDEEHGISEDEFTIDPFDASSHVSRSQATPRPKSRRSEASSHIHSSAHPHKRRPSQKATSRGISADARVEHLLLAARKIGKHRAGVISGMVQQFGERERERRREESATTAVGVTPKTPKRNTSQMGYSAEGGYVYLNGQMRPGHGLQPVPLFIPAYSHHILQTPSSSTTVPSAPSSVQKPKQDARTNNPPTPLDSLLSAARSMMREDTDGDVDEDEEVDVAGDSAGKRMGTLHARSSDIYGSPIPKRRKVLAGTTKLPALKGLTNLATDNTATSSVDTSEATGSGVGRVRSALDVLADQAAAFSTQEQSIAVPTQALTPVRGKGKDRTDVQLPAPSGSTLASRGRARSRRKSSKTDTPSSVAPTSRSRTPRSDLGDHPAGATTGIYPRADTSSPEVPVDPGGGKSSAATSNLSPQALDSTSTAEMNHAIADSNPQQLQSPDTPPLDVNDPADVDITPRQGARIQGIPGEGVLAKAIAQPDFVRPPSSTLESECRDVVSSPPHPVTTLSADESGGISRSGPTLSTAPVSNKELARVTEQDTTAPIAPAKRQRSPYVKWSKEEDDLLAQAVAKYGQKWDLVQKALPSRGYHQVRQRWLRKLGVFDSKPDLSSFQTAATTFPSTSLGDGAEPRGNPKLGLAPLSSEKVISGLRGRPSLPS